MRAIAPAVLLVSTLPAAGCEVEPFCLACPEAAEADAARDARVDAPADGGPADAARCVPSDAGEVCNGADDDCDGRIDEDFDLTADPRHCGACDHPCIADNAEFECVMGECRLTACFEGFADLDPDAPGCEYRCPVFPLQDEVCNGLDDDCDGEVDEPAELAPPPAMLCRTTPGTPCEGVVPVCATREGRTTWFCDYPAEVEFDPSVPNGIVLEETLCDGRDGDCDGVVDEPFEDLGDVCDNGARGACRDGGIVRCDPADPTATSCDLSVPPDPVPGAPSAEVCNNVDDDCDGIVDNSEPGDPRRIRDDMIHVARGGMDFYIYTYEASRPDATAAAAGVVSTRACSRPGVLPWTTVGYEAASRACAAAGHRLCTGAEWQAACEGASRLRFPYGDTYEPMTCNGADRDAVPGGPVDHALEPSGALPMCASDDGALDMSGNVKEWTDDRRGTGEPPVYVVRGGSYESPELGLTCATDLSRATADTALPTLGFRCCSDTAP